MQARGEWLVFCRNVEYLRVKNGLSLTAMAQMIHTSIHSLKRMEAGEIPDHMTASIILDLAAHFHLHPYRLFSPLE